MSKEISKTYSPVVRIGNWFEDDCLKLEELNKFLKQRSEGKLLLEKTRNLFVNFYREVALDPPSETVRFGAIVQLASHGKELCTKSRHARTVLSIIIDERTVESRQMISDQCGITVATSYKSLSRNSFIIVSPDGKDHTNEPLKFGQDFCIECVDADEKPLMVYTSPKTFALGVQVSALSDSRKRGEINLPIGLCLKKNSGANKDIPSGYLKWRCFHPDAERRFLTNGSPVPTNSPVLITHSATNRSLAAENIVIQTLFGPEYLVSAQNYYDFHKRESPRNFWVIIVGNQYK